MARARCVSFALSSNASGLCTLPGYILKQHSRQAFRLPHCNVPVCGMPLHIVSWYGLHWQQGVRFWLKSRPGFKEGILELLPSHVSDHIERYTVFELLRDNGFDINLSFLANGGSRRLIGASVSRLGIITTSTWGL